MNTLLSKIIAQAAPPPTASDSATLEKLTKLSLLEGLPRVQLTQIANTLNNVQFINVKGLSAGKLELKLPPSLALPPARQWQFATTTGQSETSGLLIAQTLSKSATQISESNFRLLIQQITAATSSAVGLQTSVNAKLVQQNPINTLVKLGSGQDLSLPSIAKKLQIGQRYNLSVESSLGSKVTTGHVLAIQDVTSKTSSPQQPFALTESDVKTALPLIIKEGLLRSGITLVAETPKAGGNIPKLLMALFPKNAMKTAAVLKVSQGQLQSQVVSSIPQLALSTPLSTQLPAPSTNVFVSKEILASLPKASVEKAVNTGVTAPVTNRQTPTNITSYRLDGSISSDSNIQTSGQTTEPTALKRSEVHNAIIELSRALLNKTGSTKLALTQLSAVLQGISNAPQANSESADVLKALTQRFNRSINDLTPKLSSGGVQPNAGELPASNSASPRDITIAKITKEVIHTLHHNLLQTSGVKSEPLNASPVNVESFLPLIFKNKHSGASLGNIKLVAPEVNSVSDGSSRLSDAITRVVQSATLPVSPLQLLSPATGGSFMQGIVSLLQISLASKAQLRSPTLKQQIDAPNSVIAKTLGLTSNKISPSKVLQDFASADAKGHLLDSLKTVLANHQHNKLSSAESRINGQDSFYYILPSVSENTLPPEIKIYREPDHKEHKNVQKGKRKLWNITMKLDIGDLGELLAKSKINDNDITLDFYTSNKTLMTKVADTLPYLTRRLTQMGIIVDKTSVQQGAIPASLNERPHHIFETRV